MHESCSILHNIPVLCTLSGTGGGAATTDVRGNDSVHVWIDSP